MVGSVNINHIISCFLTLFVQVLLVFLVILSPKPALNEHADVSIISVYFGQSS